MKTDIRHWMHVASAALMVLGLGAMTIACDPEEKPENKEEGEKEKPKEAILRVSPDALQFDAYGGTKNLEVGTNCKYYGVDYKVDWITFRYDDTKDIIYIRVEANKSGEERSENLVVFATDDKTTILKEVTVKVTQEVGYGTKTVGATGGTLKTGGDMTLAVPAGTFNTEVAVTTLLLPAGSVGTSELSDFYELTIPANTQKAITLNFAAEEYDPEAVVLIKSKGTPKHDNVLKDSYAMRTPSWSDGAYHLELEPSEQGGEGDPLHISVGMVRNYAEQAFTEPAGTRAGTAARIERHPTKSGVNVAIQWTGFTGVSSVLAQMNDELGPAEVAVIQTAQRYAEECAQMVEDFGFRLKGKNPVIPMVIQMSEDWGQFVLDKFFLSDSYVCLNENKFYRINQATESELLQLRRTLVHEIMHYYAALGYEDRTAYAITMNHITQGVDLWGIMDEAIGSWSEKAIPPHDLGDNTLVDSFYKMFLRSFFPITDSDADYTNHGYGMGLFFGFLSQHIGDDKIVDFYKQRVGLSEGNYFTVLKTVYERVLANYQFPFFTDDGYRLFVNSVCRGNIQGAAVVTIGAFSESLTLSADGVAQGLSGSKIYDYGFLSRRIIVSDSSLDMTSRKLRISQQNDDIETWVYVVSAGGNMERTVLGEAEFLELDAADFLDSKPGVPAKKILYLVELGRHQGALLNDWIPAASWHNDPPFHTSGLRVEIKKEKEPVHYSGAFVDTWASKGGEYFLELKSDGSFHKHFGNDPAVTGSYELIDYKETDGGRAWTCTIKEPTGKIVTFEKESQWAYMTYEGVQLFPSDWFM